MVSKRDLGVGYLIGTGLGLIVGLIGHAIVSDASPATTLVGTSIAVASSILFLYIGYWLRRSPLSDDHVWSVARWGTVGLGVPMTGSLLITVLDVAPLVAHLSPSMHVNTIAVGGMIGVLFGSVVQINREHETVRKLNQRNLVLNRVLRHNIRNDMNVILGYAENLKGNLNASQRETLEEIRAKATEVVNLSTSARQIGTIDGDVTGEPIDLVGVIEERAAVLRETHPGAEITIDVPEEAWVHADPLLRSVVDHLVENAIIHNDQEPVVGITVGRSADQVELRVADNGPGIPAEEFEVLNKEEETPLRHGDGLGLWLVKWFVESYDGELAFDRNDPRGTVVVVRLGRTEPPVEAEPRPAPAV